MRWTKLKKQIESRLADSISGRVEFRVTGYHYTTDLSGYEYGRGWITIDGQEAATFCDAQNFGAMFERPIASRSSDGILLRHEYTNELSSYLSLSIEDALVSNSALVRAVAMLDRRLGKRRLRKLALREDEHELVKRFFQLRCEAEGIRLPASVERSSDSSSELVVEE